MASSFVILPAETPLNILKILLKRLGIREHVGIEDKNDEWAYSIDTKLDGAGNKNIIVWKIKKLNE